MNHGGPTMVNEQPMLEAIERVTYIAQAAVEDGKAPALVVFTPDVPPAMFPFYWQDDHQALSFERSVASHAKEMGWTYGAFAVPLVMVDTEGATKFRAPTPDLPLRVGEVSTIWILGFDINVGYQVGRCLITYGPDAKPVFGDIECLVGEISLTEAPGSTLLAALLED